MINVIIQIDGSYTLVTSEQADRINEAMNQKTRVSVKMPDGSYIKFAQIANMPTLAKFKKDMKHKLATKKLHMCSRCHGILFMGERCSCKDGKIKDFQSEAIEDNPELAIEFQKMEQAKIEQRKSIEAPK